MSKSKVHRGGGKRSPRNNKSNLSVNRLKVMAASQRTSTLKISKKHYEPVFGLKDLGNNFEQVSSGQVSQPRFAHTQYQNSQRKLSRPKLETQKQLYQKSAKTSTKLAKHAIERQSEPNRSKKEIDSIHNSQRIVLLNHLPTGKFTQPPVKFSPNTQFKTKKLHAGADKSGSNSLTNHKMYHKNRT